MKDGTKRLRKLMEKYYTALAGTFLVVGKSTDDLCGSLL